MKMMDDTDSPELTDDQLNRMRPAREVLPPELYERLQSKWKVVGLYVKNDGMGLYEHTLAHSLSENEAIAKIQELENAPRVKGVDVSYMRVLQSDDQT